MILQIQPELEKNLPLASNVYIATALIKTYGYKLIKRLVPDHCKVHYIIGINLPSDLNVFKQLFEAPKSKIEALIFTGAETYHPKMYLIERTDKSWTAFVGSGNTTNGGLLSNVEMTMQVNDQEQCCQLFNWFNDLKAHSSSINEEFLKTYQSAEKSIKQRQSSTKADSAALRKILIGNQPAAQFTPLNPAQFFGSAQFAAYSRINWTDYTPAADQRRFTVREKFKALHQLIYPQFSDYKLFQLHAHHHKPSIVSHYQYRPGFNRHELQSMWLHYGYAKNEYVNDNFGNHPRIQVILHHDDIGIWLVIGKDNSSTHERERLKKRLRNDPYYTDLIFNTIKNLGGDYWIDIQPKRESIAKIETSEQLTNLLLIDQPQNYFIIGRAFDPGDPELSSSQIAETVLMEFERLYAIYLLIKH
jgi:HKD family nuclease